AAVDAVRLAYTIGAAALGHRFALFNHAGAIFLAGKWSGAMGEHGTARGKRADAGNAAKTCELPPHPLPLLRDHPCSGPPDRRVTPQHERGSAAVPCGATRALA